MNTAFLSLLVLNLVLSIAVLAVLFQLLPKRVRAHPSQAPGIRPASCGKESCGASDPIFDPAHNLREIAKQCVLLEDHLLIPAKFCQDCCAKHLLAIVGLAEEAVGLAGSQRDKVAHLDMVVEGCRAAMHQWRQAVALSREQGTPVPDQDRQVLAGHLRAMRKDIIAEHF